MFYTRDTFLTRASKMCKSSFLCSPKTINKASARKIQNEVEWRSFWKSTFFAFWRDFENLKNLLSENWQSVASRQNEDSFWREASNFSENSNKLSIFFLLKLFLKFSRKKTGIPIHRTCAALKSAAECFDYRVTFSRKHLEWLRPGGVVHRRHR